MPRVTARPFIRRRKEKVGSKGKSIQNPSQTPTVQRHVILGDFNQGDEMFDISSRGKQCTANAAVACIGAFLSDIDMWTSVNINEILRVGDNLYRRSIATRVQLQFGPEELLTVIELNTTIYNIFNYCARYEILEEDALYGNLYINHEGFPNLLTGLNLMFNTRSSGVLSANGLSVGVIKFNGNFFYFDSHSIDENGNRGDDNGKAAVIKYSAIDDMCQQILQNVGRPNARLDDMIINAYTLTPLNIVDYNLIVAAGNINALDMHDEETETHRVISNLTTYADKKYVAEHTNVNRYDIGSFENKCIHCNAYSFRNELMSCCKKGAISLPHISYPDTLYRLMTGNNSQSNEFRRRILQYNNMFAFASVGAKLQIPPGVGPSVYIVRGMIYHLVRDIFNDAPRKYAQLYFLDSSNANESRIELNRGCSRGTIELIDKLLREINPFALTYKTLHEVVVEERERVAALGAQMPSIYVQMRADKNNRRYKLPEVPHEVGAVFEAEDGNPSLPADLRVYFRTTATDTRTLSVNSSAADPMCYPLLFPYGDSGWEVGISFNNIGTRKRTNISRREYIIYRALCVRDTFNPVLSSGKLTQQYIVDAYVKLESNRLHYLRQYQSKLKAHYYVGLHDYVRNAAERLNVNVGRTVILPSSFVGGPRSMQQHFQDAMAIVARYGRPDLFVTFTCNPNWQDITRNLNPWEEACNRVDLICRVFAQKLKSFMKDVTEEEIFGKPSAYVYVVEFQKRGLPHCHILITLADADKPREPNHVDRLVCAEIPNRDDDEILFESVRRHMVHGPCGKANPNSVCMEDGKCSKQFPKPYSETTKIEEHQYPLYKRRNNGRKVTVKRGSKIYEVDNANVVPYNPWLLKKYDAHINIEICSSIKSVKYIYKYICKGHDCALLKIDISSGIYDETTQYVDARYVGASEACWRIFAYPLHGTSHVIVRLPIHLPGHKVVYFREGAEEEALENAERRDSMLEAFFELNANDEEARQYLYTEIPLHYRFDLTAHKWIKRKRSARIIPRMYTISPRQTELFYLRMLLLYVRGPRSFQHMRIVNGKLFDSFFEAAREMKLLGDDSELVRCLAEASTFQMPGRLRKLFVCLLIFCVVSEPLELWRMFKEKLSEDFRRKGYNEEVSNQKTLKIIKRQLEDFNINYKTFRLPEIVDLIDDDDQDDINECNGLDMVVEMAIVCENKLKFTEEQSSVYCRVMDAICDVEQKGERLFYLDGPGGTGKTFVYNTLLRELKCTNRTAIAVAWTGIAAILLEGGRTIHSRFRLPLNVREDSSSTISGESEEAEEIRRAAVIIWDEVTMCTVHAFNAVDRLLQDLMRNSRPFGNKVILLGGDFRQCLPVVPRGHRSKIVEMCVINGVSWGKFTHLKLTRNVRVNPEALSFSRWLLKLGNGQISVNALSLRDDDSEMIPIPDECIVSDLINEIYGNIERYTTEDLAGIQSHIILSPKNDGCDAINNKILNKIHGDKVEYFSVDKLLTDDEQEQANYPIEFLNTLTPSGMPPHLLTLKVGVPVMLLRNINIREGLCNGTRLIITTLMDNIIEAEIVMGSFAGTRVFIPRMDLTSSETSLPFTFTRRQFPLRVCFAMTVNKAQGQTFDKVGIFLPSPVFAHGQLYVAFSRARALSSVKVQITSGTMQGRLLKHDKRMFTKNVVYKSLLARLS